MKIKELIKKKGMTQKELAEKMDVSPSSLSQMLKGNMTMATLRKIARALDVDIISLYDTPEIGIKEIMQEKGITQIELAKRMGIAQSTLSVLLKNPTLSTLQRIAYTLGVTVEELVADNKELPAFKPDTYGWKELLKKLENEILFCGIDELIRALSTEPERYNDRTGNLRAISYESHKKLREWLEFHDAKVRKEFFKTAEKLIMEE